MHVKALMNFPVPVPDVGMPGMASGPELIQWTSVSRFAAPLCQLHVR
jgi:hypothetical protein